MKIEEILQERCCPSCGEGDGLIAFTMKKSQFVFNNPTHNLKWFEALNIPEAFEFPFLRCGTCNFVYTKYRLRDDYYFSFYNEGILVDKSRAKIFRKEKRVKQTEIWLNLLRNCIDKENLKVVDYGGGWGDFLAISRSPGIEVFGLEFDQRKIDYARGQGIPLGDLDFIRRNAPYDLFMCNQVMEHLDKPKEALSHLRSLLIPGALGFVGVPDFNDEYLETVITLVKQGQVPPKEVNPFGHLNYFSPYTFKRMLNQTGFEVLGPHNRREEPTFTQEDFPRSSRKQGGGTPKGNLYNVKAA
jgi:SAM-dependent methyltransferase